MNAVTFGRLRERLMEELRRDQDLTEPEILARIDRLLMGQEEGLYVRLSEKEDMRLALFNAVRRLGACRN